MNNLKKNWLLEPSEFCKMILCSLSYVGYLKPLENHLPPGQIFWNLFIKSNHGLVFFRDKPMIWWTNSRKIDFWNLLNYYCVLYLMYVPQVNFSWICSSNHGFCLLETHDLMNKFKKNWLLKPSELLLYYWIVIYHSLVWSHCLHLLILTKIVGSW
jgi:hypothetical protein